MTNMCVDSRYPSIFSVWSLLLGTTVFGLFLMLWESVNEKQDDDAQKCISNQKVSYEIETAVSTRQ
jgi:hypothetical protein